MRGPCSRTHLAAINAALFACRWQVERARLQERHTQEVQDLNARLISLRERTTELLRDKVRAGHVSLMPVRQGFGMDMCLLYLASARFAHSLD